MPNHTKGKLCAIHVAASTCERVGSIATVRFGECFEAVRTVTIGMWCEGETFKLGQLSDAASRNPTFVTTASVIEASVELGKKEAQRFGSIFEVLVANTSMHVRIACGSTTILTR